jgi:hypothetical protein
MAEPTKLPVKREGASASRHQPLLPFESLRREVDRLLDHSLTIAVRGAVGAPLAVACLKLPRLFSLSLV